MQSSGFYKGKTNTKFSLWSLSLVLLGLFLSIEPFSSLNIPLITNWYGVFSGIIVYIVGYFLGILAFFRKEHGLIKYVSLISIGIALFCVISLITFIGTV